MLSSARRMMRSDHGASALEFAIVLPVFLALLFGVIEFGFAFQAQLAVTHAAREGARLAAVDKWDSGIVESRANPLTAAGGLGIAMTESTDAVRVVVTYPYEPQVLEFLPTMDLQSSAEMRKEF